MSGAGAGSVDWEKLAPAYRRQVWLERSSLATLLRMLAPDRSSRVLDVGTGTAELLRAMATLPDRPAEAVGVDPCRGMLERAAVLPASWQLLQAAGEDLPFENESFDLVTASWLLHVLAPDARRLVIDECLRVLKPGGKFGAITIAPPRSQAAAALTAPAIWAARRFPSKLVGLTPLDPGPDLTRAGLVRPVSTRSFLGYPALCLVAEKPSSG
jgi:ubiquinone/menaquinone biosynthesis C-methylase UbiE